jgi:hypothetical protein
MWGHPRRTIENHYQASIIILFGNQIREHPPDQRYPRAIFPHKSVSP